MSLTNNEFAVLAAMNNSELNDARSLNGVRLAEVEGIAEPGTLASLTRRQFIWRTGKSVGFTSWGWGAYNQAKG